MICLPASPELTPEFLRRPHHEDDDIPKILAKISIWLDRRWRVSPLQGQADSAQLLSAAFGRRLLASARLKAGTTSPLLAHSKLPWATLQGGEELKL